MSHDAVKEDLIDTDKEFRALYEEHQECESRLEALTGKTMLSPNDEAAAKTIKLHKLHLKDRMEQMIRAHQS